MHAKDWIGKIISVILAVIIAVQLPIVACSQAQEAVETDPNVVSEKFAKQSILMM